MRRKAWTVPMTIAGWVQHLALETERLAGNVEYECWRRTQGMGKPPTTRPPAPLPQHFHHVHISR